MQNSAMALVVVSRPDRRTSLLAALEVLELDVLTVANCGQARRLLRTSPAIDVVITDVTLADGNWCDVLREVVEAGLDANVVVNAPSPDAVLWSEVLWRGVYDMLTEPYERKVVRQVIEGAVRKPHAIAGDGQATFIGSA